MKKLLTLEKIKKAQSKLAAKGLNYKGKAITFAVKYQPRKNRFSSGSNLVLCADTLEGRSYAWYSISRVIKGQLILNTYHYSSMTGKHISKLRQLFAQLNIEYKSLDAPQGLQDLERAMAYSQENFGRDYVAAKYSRDGKKETWTVNTKFYSGHNAKIKLLQSFGIKTGKNWKQASIDNAEKERREKLDRQKEKRLIDSVAIELVSSGKTIPSGCHVIHDQYFNFGYNTRSYKRLAHLAGFKKVAVCLFEKPSHLSLVSNN